MITSLEHFHHIINLAQKYQVYDIANHVLDNYKFIIWTASSHPTIHHYGKGGLVQHTREVIDLCFLNKEYYNCSDSSLNNKSIFLAALFHDSGKMWDYTPLKHDHIDWESNDHKKRIHHISRSALNFSKAVAETNSCQDIEEDVLHAILAHHGQREWGSPVLPATRLAWLLHLCDGISARFDDCYTRTKK